MAIIEVCAMYQIPVIDLNLYSGIYYNSTDDENVTIYGGDGIHVNVDGHTLIADAVVRVFGYDPSYKSTPEALYYVLDFISKQLGTEMSYPISSVEIVATDGDESGEQEGDDEAVIPITTISLSQSELMLTTGETATVTATLSPSDTTQTNIEWVSSDESKAEVVDGVITAIAEGSVTITCKSVDNSSVSATVAVTINAANSGDEGDNGDDEAVAGTWVLGEKTTLDESTGIVTGHIGNVITSNSVTSTALYISKLDKGMELEVVFNQGSANLCTIGLDTANTISDIGLTATANYNIPVGLVHYYIGHSNIQYITPGNKGLSRSTLLAKGSSYGEHTIVFKRDVDGTVTGSVNGTVVAFPENDFTTAANNADVLNVFIAGINEKSTFSVTYVGALR